jgi:hypothetical protein
MLIARFVTMARAMIWGSILGGRRTDQIQVARQLIEILPSASIVEMLRYLVEDYWGRRSGWPDLIIFRDNEFFFSEVKSATGKVELQVY